MKTIKLISTIAFLAISVGMMAQARTPVIRQHQANQHQRISQGVNSGALTQNETRNLKRQQRNIQQEKKLAKADGVVTPAERGSIKRKQKRASRRIYKEKHD